MNERPRASAALAVAMLLSACGGSSSGVSPQQPISVSVHDPAPPVVSLVYVSNFSELNPNVAAYPADGNGEVAPVAVLAGAATRMNNVTGIAFDSLGNLYVANGAWPDQPNGSCINVFAPNATGNEAPIRSICGPNTQLSLPYGIAFDANDNLYVANLRGGPFPGNGNILEFAAGASGDVAPIAVIEGDRTGISIPYDVAIDALGHLLVSNYYPGICGAQGSITVYPPNSSGNVSPMRWISGPTSQVKLPQGIAVDDAGAIYDANGSPEAVLVFAPGSNHDAPPVHRIRLINARAIAVDASRTIYVNGGIPSTRYPHAIEVYEQGSDGSYVLTRVIADALGDPEFLALH